MGARGITLAEEGHLVQALAAVDINGGTNTDVWSMKNHAHCTIIIGLGVTGGATTVTVQECDDFTPSNSTAIAFSYYAEETAGGDTLGARTAATTAGFAASTNDGVFYVIEVDADDLSDGFPNLRVAFSNPGGITFASVFALLTGARYAQEQSATAIA